MSGSSVLVFPEESSNAEVGKKDSSVVVDEQVSCFDVTMDETIDMEITRTSGIRQLRKSEGRRTNFKPSNACFRIHLTTSSSIPPGHP